MKYEEELKNKFRDTWYQEKYKYYHYGVSYSDYECSKDTWNQCQFVSLDQEKNILGYISYSVFREANFVTGVSAINFSDNIYQFGKDLKKCMTDIFEKFNFNKITFIVAVGNPVEKSYDKIVTKLGGRIVGIQKQDGVLATNELVDNKIYEIMKDDYLKATA